MTTRSLESLEFDSPTGPFILTFDGPGLVRTGWTALGAVLEAPSSSHERERRRIRRAFERYFELGDTPACFDRIETPVGTPFQHACWQEARGIETGNTRTYGWISKRVGSPGAARAVGQAMRVNPMPIVVPCHRIVGQASGSGGFSGSTGGSQGMWIKTKLLELEQPT